MRRHKPDELIAQTSKRRDLKIEVAGLETDVALELRTRLTIAIADAAKAELAAKALRIAATGETDAKKENAAADRPRVKSLAAIAMANLEEPRAPLHILRPVEPDPGKAAKRKNESEFAAGLLNLYDRLGGFSEP
jgi:hypothetical protein